MGAIFVLWLGAAHAASAPISASSEASGTDGSKRTAGLAFDGLLSTGWAEGDLGDGAGAWLEVRFAQPTDLATISIFPGYLGGADREIREYGRPKLVTVKVETAGEPVVKQERLLDPGERGPFRHDVALPVTKAKSVRLTIDEAFPGGLYSDTYISEVAINLTGGAPPPQAVVDAVSWLVSDPGKKASEAQRDAAIALFDKVHDSPVGDSDSLKILMNWASDGAPFAR
jgi:hypothetical protein